MLSKGQYFPDQKRDEQIVLFIRGHWLSFLPWIIFLSAMVIVPVIIFSVIRIDLMQNMNATDRAYLIIGSSAYFLITLAIFLTAWISYYFNVCIVTPEHLVDIRQNGLFNRKVSEQSLLRVQDVSAHMTGLLQTFFRYGTVYVETAGEAPNFHIPNIPDPNRVANKILKLHEELVKESGYTDKDMAEGVGLENPAGNIKVKTPNKIIEKSEKIINPNQTIKQDEVKKEIPKEKVKIEEFNNTLKPDKLSQKRVIYNEAPSGTPKNIIDKKDYFSKNTEIKEKNSFSQSHETTKNEKKEISKSANDPVELKEGEVINLNL